MNCPCDKPDCMVKARERGAYVQLDALMVNAGVSKLKNCVTKPSKTQAVIIKKYKKMQKNPFKAMAERWAIDGESLR